MGTGFDGAEQPADKNRNDASWQPGQSNSETAENRDQSGAGESRPSGDHGAAPSDNSQEAQTPGDKPGDKGADTTGTTRPEPETQSPGNDDPGPSDSGQETDKADGRFSVADGTYEGTGSGFRRTTTVSVTVKDNAITDITIQSYEDDTAFFTRAKDTIISEIISTQSLDVPTVSGATFSSNSILNAVADALGTGSPSAEQPADNESNSGTDQPEADGGNGQGAGQPGSGGGNGQGTEQPGNGGGNGQGAGQPGNGSGNGQGTGQPDNGSGNGQGAGQPGNGSGNGQGTGQPDNGSGNGQGAGQPGNGSGNGQGQTGGGRRGNGWRGSGGSGGGQRGRGN